MEKYVDRALRYGNPPKFDTFLDDPFIEHHINVPVSDDTGAVTIESHCVERIPASEYYKQFNVDDFKLSVLIESGVPLSVINVNKGILSDVNKLTDVVRKLGYLENLVKDIESQKISVSDVENLNNVVE